ncbi:MAG: PaaI family thioesterase [Spirochaetaceae bacterium]|nr:MAG: PaaI family thioesterase [Spirochaetaceae bacterium]
MSKNASRGDGPRTVPNPYAGHPDYRCFGCDPDNPTGLKLEFAIEGRRVISHWQPRADLEGYPGVTHGGILATLADEVAAWYIHAVLGTAGMTRELSVTYHAPALAEEGPFRVEAAAVEEGPKSALIEVTISGRSGTLFCTARCSFAVFSEAVARRRLDFPGREAFRPVD